MTGDETRGEAEAPTDVARLADAEGAEVEARRRYDHAGFHGGRGLIEDCVHAFVKGAEYQAARDRARDAEARRVVERVEAIHEKVWWPSNPGWRCRACDVSYPCPTVDALAETGEQA